jgi:hypothetical protein
VIKPAEPTGPVPMITIRHGSIPRRWANTASVSYELPANRNGVPVRCSG